MEKGFFKEHGVDITGILTSHRRRHLGAQHAGRRPAVRRGGAGRRRCEAINNGEPLKIIGAGVQSVADILWMAKKGSPLHSIKDLAGKKVGFTSPGSVTNMLILMALKAKGIDRDRLQLVPAGGIGANVSAVMNGAVDAGMTGEPIWARERGQAAAGVLGEGRAAAEHDADRRASPPTTIANPIPTKLRAHPRGAARRRRVHRGSIRTRPPRSPPRPSTATRRCTRRCSSTSSPSITGPTGQLDYDGMNRMVEGLQIVGQQKGPVDWSKIIDTSFLPAA